MLYDLDAFRERCSRRYSVEDLTLVLAIRAHDGNPWVKDRLRLLGRYYDPAPYVVVVDFGSVEEHRDDLERISRDSGFDYVYEEDLDTFSLARARNIGAASARTDLLFFSDIDCFGERDLCRRLVRQANVLDLGACFDQVINLPVYHLNEEVSAAFFQREDLSDASEWLGRALVHSVYARKGDVADFVDPSSNFFVCHRRFYDLVGGYNEKFRGHGSEDFEFTLRFALHSGQFPLPARAQEDYYSPSWDSFYRAKQYRGFRRLGELMAFESEAAGLRIAHLHHPRPRSSDGWYRENDWKRRRFNVEVQPFLDEPARLLSYDWMPRDKVALVLLTHRWHYEFFVPLRLAGYRLVHVLAGDTARYEATINMLEHRTVDAVAMFNPYMHSHLEMRPFFELARKSGIATIVVERGALPESWYYAPDVSYNDADWRIESVEEAELSDDEIELAGEYIDALKTGASTLEGRGDITRTLARYGVYSRVHPRTCLVPFQLEHDIAVTQSTDGHISYEEFRTQVAELVADHPDILFFVKPHPLSNTDLDIAADNVIVCTSDDNIHGLLEVVDAVICYNSGVGLLGLLHGKRVVTVGNAYYNLRGLGHPADDFAHAVHLAFESDAPFNDADVRSVVAWLLFRKYSFFKAESVLRDFGHRKAHDYRNLRFYHFNFEGAHASHLRARVTRPFDTSSYASGRLGVRILPRSEEVSEPVPGQSRPAPAPEPPRPTIAAATGAGSGNGRRHQKGNSKGGIGRKLRKLQKDPRRFFGDSRHAPLRWLGETFMD